MSEANLAIPGVADATEIGRGGFGVVYRATEAELGRDVAVKVLSGKMDDRSRIRFERERKAMGALSGHPNIITIFRSGITDEGALYLVMEYISGGSLAERLIEHGPAGWEETLRVGVELCGALETAHRAGVLHRDVKPGNIMMDALGRAKLGDFGIARLEGGPETKSAVITASVAHAPPEVIAGDKPDERSDIYSLASTLFELASGSPAFVRPTDESMIPMFARIVNDSAPDLRQKGMPDPLATALEKAMSKPQDGRFTSAAEFGRALADAQRALGHAESRLWIEGEPRPTQPLGQSTQVVPPPISSAQAPPPPAPPNAPAPPSAPSSPGQPLAPPSHSNSPAPPSPQPPPAPIPTATPMAATPPPAATSPGSTTLVPGPGASQSTGQNYNPGQPPAASYSSPGHNNAPAYALPSYEQQAPSSQGSRNGGMLAAIGLGSLAILAGLAVLAASLGSGADDENEAQRLTSSESPVNEPGSATIETRQIGESSSTESTSTPPTTQATTTTATLPPRPGIVADLPSLPSVQPPYVGYRTLSDPDGAFTFRVPLEWVDELGIEGQVITSPDNNAALGAELISGAVVSGTQGIGVWDADLFLNELLKNLSDPDDPCSELQRDPFVDGPFDGLLYAESCRGGDMLVVNIVVSSPDRDAVILIAVQMIDERDFAALEEILASFILADPTLLPEAS